MNFVWVLGLTLNFRYIAAGNYLMTALSDFVLGFLYFAIFKHMQNADTKGEVFAYAIGGTLSPLLAIYLTRHT